ncbi:hypothetical protein KGQ34_00115 [Patescibacteria group bacterium]|nr:hypothetical protein [Patescibacteria group bacterium]
MAGKKNKNSELSETKRHFGVILEHIDSKVKLVLEGHRGLDKKIDKYYEEFGGFRREVNYNFDIVLSELRLIRNELKEKVGRDEFAFLEKRVIALEKSRK